MFRWPKTDNPLEWFLGWLIGTVANLFTGLVGTLANLFSGQGTFTQWVAISLFVVASLLLWDALTFQWLVSLSNRFGVALRICVREIAIEAGPEAPFGSPGFACGRKAGPSRFILSQTSARETRLCHRSFPDRCSSLVRGREENQCCAPAPINPASGIKGPTGMYS